MILRSTSSFNFLPWCRAARGTETHARFTCFAEPSRSFDRGGGSLFTCCATRICRLAGGRARGCGHVGMGKLPSSRRTARSSRLRFAGARCPSDCTCTLTATSCPARARPSKEEGCPVGSASSRHARSWPCSRTAAARSALEQRERREGRLAGCKPGRLAEESAGASAGPRRGRPAQARRSRVRAEVRLSSRAAACRLRLSRHGGHAVLGRDELPEDAGSGRAPAERRAAVQGRAGL
jgi:hypothetical protein